MKTPEEIKKAFECCMQMAGCANCPYSGEKCALQVSADALAYIEQLEDHILDLTKKIEAQSGASRKAEEGSDVGKED